jgi:hypothetical protein
MPERAEPKAAPSEGAPAPAEEPPQAESSREDDEQVDKAPPAEPGAASAPKPLIVLPDGTEATLERAEAAQRSLLGELDRSLELGALDCASAEQHRGAICEIAKRICALAEGNEGRVDALDAAALCKDSKDRCSRARERYGKACAR